MRISVENGGYIEAIEAQRDNLQMHWFRKYNLWPAPPKGFRPLWVASSDPLLRQQRSNEIVSVGFALSPGSAA